jgi:hypothetical protein
MYARAGQALALQPTHMQQMQQHTYPARHGNGMHSAVGFSPASSCKQQLAGQP